MKKVMCFTLIFLGCYTCGSNKDKCTSTCTTIGVVDKVVWKYERFKQPKKVAYLSFMHDYQNYTFRHEFANIMKINTDDSVQIQFCCNNPKKATFLKLLIQNSSEQREETKIITYKRVSGVERYSYHGVNKKPLFKSVENDVDNKKAVDLYIKEQLKKENVQEHGTVGISIVIDITGRVVESNVLHSNNREFNNYVLNIIKDMPLWTPAEHKGKIVNVDFLIVLEW